MFNSRQEDLSKVFDRTWKANHNDVAKRGREREKQMMKRLYSNDRPTFNSSKNTVNESVSELQNRMNNAFNANRSVNMNNIAKKWK